MLPQHSVAKRGLAADEVPQEGNENLAIPVNPLQKLLLGHIHIVAPLLESSGHLRAWAGLH